MAFAGIPDPHDCPGIDVLESPSKHPPGLSLLRVSCKKPVTHLFQQKTSIGPELLQKFQEDSWTFLHCTSQSWSLDQELWATPPETALGTPPPPPATAVSPHICHSDGSPAKIPELSLQETSCISQQHPSAQFLGLWPFSPPCSRNSWAHLAGMCNQPHREQRQGGLWSLRTDLGISEWHSMGCSRFPGIFASTPDGAGGRMKLFDNKCREFTRPSVWTVRIFWGETVQGFIAKSRK